MCYTILHNISGDQRDVTSTILLVFTQRYTTSKVSNSANLHFDLHPTPTKAFVTIAYVNLNSLTSTPIPTKAFVTIAYVNLNSLRYFGRPAFSLRFAISDVMVDRRLKVSYLSCAVPLVRR